MKKTLPSINQRTRYFLGSAFLVGIMGCQAPTSQISSSQVETSVLAKSPYNVNLYKVNTTVCDPFGGGSDLGDLYTPLNGIKAELYYKTQFQNRFYSAQEYIDKTNKSTQTLFFSDLNAPTRMFSQGFSTQSSDVVKDDMGAKLVEYFGIKFTTTIRISSDMPEGNYELGTLADDGIVVKAQINGQWQTVVNSDGDHPTKMGCSQQALAMTRSTQIPIEVTYYQGPRYHIAAVLMWRKLDSQQAAGQDQECNKLGNEYFFNPNLASTDPQFQKAPYLGLLNRGWMPIQPESYYLESFDSYNPCYLGESPKISGFSLSDLTGTTAQLKWTTDIPSTSQILLIDESTGLQVVTDSDNNLRTDHIIDVSNLKPRTIYQVKAVSISASLGKAISSEVRFRTGL